MARSLSNTLLKGIARLPATYSLNPTVSGSSYHHGMRFSTTVTSDSGTHDDFKPTDKLASSGTNAKDVVEKDVKENPVMIYMKGVLAQPQCGFSALAVRVLSLYQVPLNSRNILESPELKTAVKSFSNWPTFPQIFIKGEFIGGSDIILNMHQTGELKDKLRDLASEVSEEKSE
ncbi:Monothiol glutaredoxin-s15 protein [Thalictrum thalictroides]|uniref:Monothiol glutaredoxin-s15 protein n=1 Tax=Thalictrum thalictroides TaxID=46969 RepID=A0A7J6UUP5_THATH|nr:Monothiol glutaredoxin-s15 protein [Thalictrum thalictroides]